MWMLLLSIHCTLAQSVPSHDPALEPYIEFLRQPGKTAAEYLVGLFRHKDLVIICERAHPDLTQYDLFLSVIRDPRFVESAGYIFTEVGVANQTDDINRFLTGGPLPPDSVDRALIRFQRDCSFFPLWDNTNYSYFLRGVYELNCTLPPEKRISVFNSDMPFDWSSADETSVQSFWSGIQTRDSIIATQVIRKFDHLRSIPGARRKALAIMNYRHAFGHRFERTPGVKPQNVGRYLFDRYGGLAANVYLNFVALKDVRSDTDMTFSAIQDGTWDAAFATLRIEDAGFPFAGSPFGRDTFDIWPAKVGFTYEEVFDGFVFYLPLEKHLYVTGMPGLVDDVFAAELVRRYALLSALPSGRFKPLTDVEGLRVEAIMRTERRMDGLDSLVAQIRKWRQPE
jgi:hypothetical protein